MKYTDYKKVKVLCKGILEDDKKLINSTAEFEMALRSLEISFLDDGIDEVKNLVADIEAILIAAQDAFMVTVKELKSYADLLEEGK